ncbi:MAG: PLxRFG domain-containing protein [Gammaproteobacteria bacterium]
MLIQKIPQWYKAHFKDQDAAFAALNERTLRGYAADSEELRTLRAGLNEAQRGLFDSATKMISDLLTEEFQADQPFMRRVLISSGEYEKWVTQRSEQVKELIDKGYVPLRRYGDFTVHVYIDANRPDGTPYKQSAGLQFFGSQRKAIATAKVYEEEIARSGSTLKVETGTHYKAQRDTTISPQQFIDTARRNGIALTALEQERMVKALSAADSLIRNRMLQREGMPGFSTDGMRVLNEFGLRMSGKLAYSRFASAIDAARDGRAVESDVISGVPEIKVDQGRGETESVEDFQARNLWKREGPMSGFHHNLADELVDYVLVPDHTGGWSRKLRGAAMSYFIGGSISNALVNVSSVPMLLVPELSIHTNYANALSTTMGAWMTTWRYQHILRDITRLKSTAAEDAIPGISSELRQALVAAAQYTMDTELHQIMGISQGALFSQSRGVQRAMKAWMSPFQISEQTNRITSFIAAYKIASTDGVKQPDGSFRRLSGPELFRFSRDIIDATQNNYNPNNRPGAARNPVFALMFMFKSFPLFITEAAVLMYKADPRAAVYMLLGLTAMTGVQGLPFAEAIEDMIDTISQNIFGSPFNVRRAMRNTIKSASEAITGYDMSELVLRGGINAIAGYSASSRIGAGDFVPGSNLGTANADQGKILSNFLGAPYSMVHDVAANAGAFVGGVFTGDWKQTADALRAGGPIAVRNLIKGAEQWQSGYASDSRGRKLVDVTGLDSMLQFAGVSSAALAKAYAFENINQQTKAFYTQVSKGMQEQLAQALKAGDTEKVQEINDMRNAWNRQYPQMPILINPASVRRDIMLSGVPLDRRSQMIWARRIRGENIFSESQ